MRLRTGQPGDSGSLHGVQAELSFWRILRV